MQVSSGIQNRKCLNPECKNREHGEIWFVQFSKSRILCKICLERALAVITMQIWEIEGKI